MNEYSAEHLGTRGFYDVFLANAETLYLKVLNSINSPYSA